MVHVVIGRITIGNILQREAPNETDDGWIGGLKDSVDLAVLVFKLLDGEDGFVAAGAGDEVFGLNLCSA